MTLTFGSLFSGIGGIDLGFERAGLECLWQIENDDYCNRVLAKHWPTIPRYGDIEGVNGADLPTPDIICGGFPCQPVSHAGRREGRRDPRWLWPQMARLVDEVRPAYVVVENVPGLLSKGGAEVLADLATMGFDAEWGFVSARDAGAPHIRERVWIVAHSNRNGNRMVDSQDGLQDQGRATGATGLQDQGRATGATGRAGLRRQGDAPQLGVGAGSGSGRVGTVADPERARLEGLGGKRQLGEGGEEVQAVRRGADGGEEDAPHPDSLRRNRRPRKLRARWGTESEDGGWWAVEPAVGRVAHGVPSRVDRLRALGNAVVPQVAEMVARRVLEIHRDHLSD